MEIEMGTTGDIPIGEQSDWEGMLPGRIAGNQSTPILLAGVMIDGISAEATKPGQMIKIWTRLSLVSDSQLFHKIVPPITNAIEDLARQSGSHIRLSKAEVVLLVIREDNSAELWVDAAAMALSCLVRRSVQLGTVLFDHDIVDVTGMSFPCVDFRLTDKVICLFREDWRFGFYANFNPKKHLDIAAFSSDLGTLYRTLKYRHLYDAMADENVSQQLLEAGWFPFAEIITSEFRDLLNCCEAGFELAEVEAQLLEKFDDDRLDRILERWLAKPHYSSRATILTAAINAFKAGEPVSVIKILLTEIEGILNEAHKTAKGHGAKLKQLLEFAEASGEGKAGRSDTLLFSSAFATYLKEKTFGHFDPVAENGTAGSRHAVGHGAAKADSYTMTRAIQAILTLDQLAFFT